MEDFVIPTGTGTGTIDQSFIFTADRDRYARMYGSPRYYNDDCKRVQEHYDFADPSVADRTVIFTLTLVENIGSNDDTYAITLSDLGGTALVTFAAAAVNFVPDGDLVLQDCVTFPDLLG